MLTKFGRISIILLVGLFCLLLPNCTLASDFEMINDFQTQVTINNDSSINVREEIVYDFADQESHGIYRFIPISYQARGGNYRLRISDISVTDETGANYNFTISYPGKNIELKIGDANRLISGQHTYIISYKVKKAINYFDTWDELYWNITGNEWEVPIKNASASIVLPDEIPFDNLQTKCFSGPAETNYDCQDTNVIQNKSGNVSKIEISSSDLGVFEGLTIVIGFPKKIVLEPTASDKFFESVKDNGILLLPVFVLGFMVYLWRVKGRDPKGRGTIIAQYDAPDSITAAEVGTIIDERVQTKDISAQIIQFAVNGNLRIVKGEKKADYTFVRLNNGPALNTEFEKELFNGIFGTKDSIKLDELKNKFYKDYGNVSNKLYKETVNKKYFARNPKNVRLVYNGIGVLLFISGFFAGVLGAYYSIAFILSGIIVMIFSLFMPSKTIKGAHAREHIIGLKTYLSVAEKDRIKFHNSPEKKPEHFDHLLPYAMVLGVEKEWANQFADIYNQQPSWYQGPAGTNFSTLYLVSSLNSFQTSANSAMISRPSSASSGGSGFSGGGFSGGGFGGGGGGSW
jgi:uncharacterized membrane protein